MGKTQTYEQQDQLIQNLQVKCKHLLAEIATRDLESAKKDQEIAKLNQEIATRDQIILGLQETLDTHMRYRFGKKTEQHPELIPAIQLFNEAELLADKNLAEPNMADISNLSGAKPKSDKNPKQKGKRQKDLSNLQTITIHHKLSEQKRICPKCGSLLREMSSKRLSPKLIYVPAQYIKEEHICHNYCCDECEKTNQITTIVSAPTPAPLIENSICSPSLLANIITEKFDLALPLYRQERTRFNKGILISRQTLSNWVLAGAEWLVPIYDLLHKEVCANFCIHADETTLKVIKNTGAEDRQKTYMWLYMTSGCTEKQAIVYEWQPSRSAKHPAQFLKDFSGYCMVDGYKGYRNIEGVIPVGCWAHARRRFESALDSIDFKDRSGTVAEQMLALFNKLFHLETTYADKSYQDRYEARIKYSLPITQEIIKQARAADVLPKSKIGRAISYLLEQLDDLMQVFSDGRLELSNNRAERAIKPFVIGRKNWLFSNTANGAYSSAILYSIVESAKANGINPYDYLNFLFEELPNTTSSQLEGLLPWNVALPDKFLQSG